MPLSVPPVGVTQGRLSEPRDERLQSFPIETWPAEFERASTARLSFIEWIYDRESAGCNPLLHEAGIERLKELATRTGVRARSVCADALMERPLFDTGADGDAILADLENLLDQASRAGMEWVVLPLFKASLVSKEADLPAAADRLRMILAQAERLSMPLHLETALPADLLLRLLESLAHPLVGVTYDMGNSTYFGYSAERELALLQPWIASVHVKDHIVGGPSVPLGQGQTPFTLCFEKLVASGYDGPIVLQAARGERGKEVALQGAYRQFVVDHWMRAQASATTRA
jgi:sugar phosphate isomerase/epimerase